MDENTEPNGVWHSEQIVNISVTFDQCPRFWLANFSSLSSLIGSQTPVSRDILGGHLACVLENTNESNITETIVELLDKNIQWQAFHHLYRLNEMKGILYSVFVTPFCSLSFSFRYHWKGENNTNVTNLSNSNTGLDNSSKK